MARKRKAAAAAPKAEKKTKTKTTNGAPAPGQAAGTTAGSNTGVRGDIMRTAFQKMYECDRDIAAAKAQHVKPLQEERGDIWKNVKNDLNAQSADLKPLYAIFKRDRELVDFDNEDKAGKSIDLLREGFETLRTGETLNFLSVLGEPHQPELETTDVKTARSAGRQAGQAGKPGAVNPHGAGGDLHDAWNEGHLEGMKENLPGQADEHSLAH